MSVNCFNGYEPIFHYTTFESAIKILASKKLRFGVMNKMNDPDESFRQIFINTGRKFVDNYNCLSIDAISEEFQHYQQISFSCSSPKKAGFQLQNMWGNYADKGYGVCLVFDKKIINEMHPSYSGKVRYSHNNKPTLMLPTFTNKKDFHTHISKHIKSIFFKKSDEWRSEQEYRIIQYFEKPTNNYLSLHNFWENALKCIIFTYAPDVALEENVFNSSNFKAISMLAHNSCMLLQKAKDINGNDILYDSNRITKWGQIINESELEI